MRNPKLKKAILVFFIFQLSFSMFGEQVLGRQNIFPFYTWKIFHTRPDKYAERYAIYIHQIDGDRLPVPADLMEIKHRFRSVKMYTVGAKVRNLGQGLDGPERERLLAVVNQNLLMDHSSVEWELVWQRYDVVEYYMNRHTLDHKSLGVFRAGEAGR